MILALLIIIPLVGGALALALGRLEEQAPKWVSVFALVAELSLAAGFLGREAAGGGQWLLEARWRWIPGLGTSLHFAMDGVGLLLVLLTALVGLMAAAASWTGIRERSGFFHFNMLFCLAGVVGVFLSMDLLVFYFFWELMLVPMYLMIALWGHENRLRASVKFFIFTQLSGLLMLAAILGLYFANGRATGLYTFDYAELMGAALSPALAALLMAGFLAAFLVKLPAFLLHTWLPDAHTEAPTGGSVILAGLLLKTGAYGLLRFAAPLFPGAAVALGPWLMALGAAGVLYGAALAFAQSDLKRLVAYTSVSHMGFVLLGISAGGPLALHGSVIEMISHGLSTGMLFFLVGALEERTGTRDAEKLGGLWAAAPRTGGLWLVFALASLGLPGFGNFVGEFLVLLGAFSISPLAASAAALGLVASVIYALWMMKRVFFGEKPPRLAPGELGLRETAVSAVAIAALLGLGLYPQPVMDQAKRGLDEAAAARRAVVERTEAISAGKAGKEALDNGGR